MKKFYNVVNSIIYRTREARALIVLNIDRECNFSCKMVKNCSYRYELNREKNNKFSPRLCDKQTAPDSTVYLRCDV